MQENCVKSAEQIQILGVCRNFYQLPRHIQEMTYNDGERGSRLKNDEEASS
jgi:hypothetical protein